MLYKIKRVKNNCGVYGSWATACLNESIVGSVATWAGNRFHKFVACGKNEYLKKSDLTWG